MSIVVTGATGHLGRLAIEALLARGVPATTLVAAGRTVSKLTDLAERGVRVVAIDYIRPETLLPALTGAEKLLLVSGTAVGERVAEHSNVVAAAREAGVKHLVYTSAPRADTSPLVLAPDHKGTESVIRASGIPFTILRNNWYTENYAGTLQQARATGEVVGSAGDGRVASASRHDYAEAAAAVLTQPGHEGRTHELSGDTAWDFVELAAAIGGIIGREVAYRPLSTQEHLEFLTSAGLDEGTAGFVVTLDGNIRDGLLSETSGDLSRIIGRPTTPLSRGLAAAVAAMA